MCQSKRQLKFFNAIGEIFVSSFTTSDKGLNNQLYLDNTKCVAINWRTRSSPLKGFKEFLRLILEFVLYHLLHSDNSILYLIQLLLRLKHWTFCNIISAWHEL